jgi:DNA-binding transcriptional LysR family regulator
MRASPRSSATARKLVADEPAKIPAPTPPPEKFARTGLTSLNRLHCFEVVVQESGFKRATSRLHITQPALSYQMKHLEDELGVQLFLRRPGGVTLTDAGRLLYTHVQRVSAAVRRAEQAVKELPAVGEVRVGTVNSIGTYFLPHVLQAVHEGHASTVPTLYRARSDDHIEALLASQVDLAILADPRVDKRLHYETLFEERVSLVWSRSHPFSGATRVRPEQLEGAPMVALSPQTPTGALVQKYLESLGVSVEPVVSTEDVLTVKRMVEMGIGAAFLPDMVTRREVASRANPDGRLQRAEFEPPLTRRIVLVTWDEVPSSLAVKTVVDEVRRQSTTWQGGRANANG